MDRRFRLHPAVFYRKYADKTVLYHTRQQKVFTFNLISGIIFDIFKEYRGIDEAIKLLSDSYTIDDEESVASVKGFIEQMLDKGVLDEEFRQREVTDTLEKQVGISFAKNHQLFSVLFELTYRCNERCRHCYIAKENKQELSTEKIKAVLDDLAGMNVLSVIFTGGEVFARNDAFEILEYAYQKGFVIDIFTNGTLIDGNDYIRLKQIYPRSVQFSLYSHIAKKHDSITRLEGSFEKTVRSIKACKAIGIPVNIKTPVFEETLEDAVGMVGFAGELGVSIEIGSNITPKKDGDLAPTKMEIEDISKEIALTKMLSELIPADRVKQVRCGDDNLRICGAGDKSLSIDPYGQVFPCNMLQLSIGDLNERSISDIWNNSGQLKRWRNNNFRRNRKGCENCDLSEECAFCPGEAMMRTGDPLCKYEKACKTTYNLAQRNGKGGC